MKKTIGLLLLVAIAIIYGCSKDNFIDSDEGTFKDTRDKQVYQWVRIGTQIWMAENLAYLPTICPTIDGALYSPYYNVTGYEGASAAEAKTTANFDTYGVLYNFEAAKTACPAGWHLPADSEWKTLELFLGMSETEVGLDGPRMSGSVGEKLKSATGWDEGGNGTNSCGFKALPGGYREGTGGFFLIGISAAFWTATTDQTALAWDRFFTSNSNGIDRGNYERSDGYSIRCVRD